MSFEFVCPYCNAVLQVEDEWENQQCECPMCQNTIHLNRRPWGNHVRPGVVAATPPPKPSGVLFKSRVIYILLALFFGGFGIHDFYAGYYNRGLIKLLLTVLLCAFCGFIVSIIWSVVDIFTIKEDADGYRFA